MKLLYYEENKEYVKLRSKLYYYQNRKWILEKAKTNPKEYDIWKEQKREYQHNYYLKTKASRLVKQKIRRATKKLNKPKKNVTLKQSVQKKKRENQTKLQKHVTKIKRNIKKVYWYWIKWLYSIFRLNHFLYVDFAFFNASL